MADYTFRRATLKDAPFLREMLYEAATWNYRDNRPPMDRVLAEPELGKILDDWESREGDTAIIAEDEEGNAVGAVWYRFWTDEDHSYGYVDEAVPELGLGVKTEHRRRGVGSRLMAEIIRHARRVGIRCLSLSVIPENHALKLYERTGFRKVGQNGAAWTMVLEL